MSLRHYPAIAHQHGDLRQELASFSMVLNAVNCPPPGHAFHGALNAAVHYFERELPRHVEEEETQMYPLLTGTVSPASLATLREQHQAILIMAGMFTRLYPILQKDPADKAWAEIRHIGQRLVTAIRQHLDDEDAVLGSISPPLQGA